MEKEFLVSDCIFIGKVIRVDESKDIHGAPIIKAEFEVVKSYKGVKNKFFSVVTNKDGKACGFPFKVNSKYLVFANVVDAIVTASSCSQTKEISDAPGSLGSTKEELATLDKICSPVIPK